MSSNVHTEEEDDGVNRKRLVRILLVLAIGIPLIVEGATFTGLISTKLLGGGADDGAATATPTPTPAVERVGVGEQLLPDTEPDERVTTTSLRAESGNWVYTMSVTVNNTSNSTYELRLHSITTGDGTTVAEVSSVTLDPGERGAVTGQWALPEGSRPDYVAVVAVSGTGDDATTIRREVPVERVPVQGS